jgi:AcrR family transcriptional regulator
MRTGQREAARKRVEELALSMFSRHGFDAVTVEDICAEAGIAPATFYRYFGTKESIVFFYEKEFLAAARDIGESVDPQQDTLDQLRHILGRCMHFFEEQSDMLALRDEIVLPHTALLQRTLAIQRKFETSLAEALAARDIGESVDPQQDTLDQLRHILGRCMHFFEEQSDMLALRDEIVLPHTALLQRTLAIQRKFETSLAEALAARRPGGSTAEASLDAAVCLMVLRLGLRAWRSDADSDLAAHTSATFESLRARLR